MIRSTLLDTADDETLDSADLDTVEASLASIPLDDDSEAQYRSYETLDATGMEDIGDDFFSDVSDWFEEE